MPLLDRVPQRVVRGERIVGKLCPSPWARAVRFAARAHLWSQARVNSASTSASGGAREARVRRVIRDSDACGLEEKFLQVWARNDARSGIEVPGIEVHGFWSPLIRTVHAFGWNVEPRNEPQKRAHEKRPECRNATSHVGVRGPRTREPRLNSKYTTDTKLLRNWSLQTQKHK